MRELYDKETNFRTYGCRDEFGAPPREGEAVREPEAPAEMHESEGLKPYKNEYNENAVFEYVEQKTKKRHDVLKQFVLKPAVSLTLVASLAYTAFGIDFLGDDYLNSAFTTMNSNWLEEHPEDWGSEPHTHWDEPYDDPDHDPWSDPQDDGFPELENLWPDYDGRYSWGEEGPELYLRFYTGDEENGAAKYLVKGKAWEVYDPEGELVEKLDGAYYDSSTNTLTLENFSCYMIDTNLMGNGFTIRLAGESNVEYLSVWGAGYGGSVTFEGSGMLTAADISLNAEASRSCVMVRGGATLRLLAQEENAAALSVYGTLFTETPLFLAPGVYIEGGVMALDRVEQYEDDDGETYGLYNYVMKSSGGSPEIIITGG